MSEDGFIKFEITEDDIDSEFNPFRAKRLTKNQQIYGVWASDDDSEDDAPSTKFSAKKNKNYTAPVSFIAGGIHQPGKKAEEKAKEKDENSQRKMDVISDSSDEELARPSFFPKAKTEETDTTESEMAGFRRKGFKEFRNMAGQSAVGNWELHTKGVGSKILLKMGYQPGKGLGKDLQGINAPIEAHLRKGRGAIGAYGPEKKQQKMKTENQKDESEAPKKSDKTSLWRKEGSRSRKKIDYVYKSIDDVIEESKKPGKKKTEISECSKVMVIDMTGPEQRILSGYHAIAGVQKPTEEWEIRKDKKFSNFSMPELLHNLDLLVNVSEEDIVKNDRKLKYSDDRIKLLENQVRELNKTTKQEKYLIDNYKEMSKYVDSVVKASKNGSLTLEKAEEIFTSLKEKYPTEFQAYEMPTLAVSLVRPLFKKFMETWKPLLEPLKPIPEFVKWRTILSSDDASQAVNSYKANVYHKLIWDTLIPHIRCAVNSWECRNWRPMYDLLMNWIPLISPFILENILREMILLRIQNQVDAWDPQSDQIPIHLWIHPWMNFLGKSFETSVYPTIRQKLSKALIKWHPSDSSARSILQPWVNIFESGKMEAFLVNNILPKLEMVLKDLVINPRQQCLNNWNWVMDWHEMMPPHSMANLLNKYFFPEWLKVLRIWLSNNPNFDEIREWISGWEMIIPDRLKSESLVQDNMKSAFMLINEAIGGERIAAAVPDRPRRQEVGYGGLNKLVRRLSIKDRNMIQSTFFAQEPAAAEVPVTLKSMAQLLCENRGIELAPIPNRFIEANQVYKCGKLNVYFDRNFIFVSQGGGSFAPMSWLELVENV